MALVVLDQLIIIDNRRYTLSSLAAAGRSLRVAAWSGFVVTCVTYTVIPVKRGSCTP
jgi:hypothetical protein